jgi:hypothetical protein
VAKLGNGAVMRMGMVGLAVVLLTSLAWDPEMSYWPLGLWFFGLSMSMGWIMGPATSSVMGCVPEAKAGVASAMNDVTRQVGGALGTAVVGSLITSIYASKIADSTAAMPEAAQTAAEDSIGQANAIAANLPVAEGARLVESAGVAFTDAVGIGFAIAAALALVAGVAVRRWLPDPAGSDGATATEVEVPAGVAPEGAAA